MDRGRLIAALACAAACRGASAAPAGAPANTSIAVPSGWIALPRVADSARAAGAGLHAAAWGDPAAGCYVVVVTARGEHEDEARARAAMDEALGVSASAGSGAALRQAGLTGTVRGWSQADGDDVVSTAAACVYNDREPAPCAASCDAVWAKLAGPPVIP